jgi:hypothetical protein
MYDTAGVFINLIQVIFVNSTISHKSPFLTLHPHSYICVKYYYFPPPNLGHIQPPFAIPGILFRDMLQKTI